VEAGAAVLHLHRQHPEVLLPAQRQSSPLRHGFAKKQLGARVRGCWRRGGLVGRRGKG
jgi:hypothetical protein